jgi:hypothetical protein
VTDTEPLPSKRRVCSAVPYHRPSLLFSQFWLSSYIYRSRILLSNALEIIERREEVETNEICLVLFVEMRVQADVQL